MKELIGFEIKKLLRQKLIIYSVIALLALNIFNIVQNNHQYLWGRDVSYNKASYEVYKKVSGRLDKDKISWLSENQQNLSYLISANLKIPDEYKNWGCTHHELSQIFTEHLSEIERIYSYNSYIKDLINKNGEHFEITKTAGNDYLVKVNEKIASTYENREINVYYDTDRFSAYLDYGFSSFVVLLIILLAVSSVFSGENESGMSALHHSTKKGRAELSIAKIIAVSVFIAVVCLIFSFSDFITFKAVLRLQGYSAPVYSMSAYTDTPLQMSIGSFVILAELIKMIGFIFGGLIICFMSSVMKKSFIVFSAGLVSSIGLMLLSAYSNMYLDYVNLINPINLITVSVMFKQFKVINIMGNPIFNHTLTLFCCLFGMLSFALFIIAANNKNSRKTKKKGGLIRAGFKS